MPSFSPVVERSKPLLGTFVRVRVGGLDAGIANQAISRCFAEVADIHRLMSFQEQGSDISRLNAQAHRRPVRVDSRTYEVLQIADGVSSKSGGIFDVTVAPLVATATLEGVPAAACPDADARWNDVELLPDLHVRFARPLWIDVSGIAKGYAVDRAIELLATFTPEQVCVNAGGDIRALGAEPEWVRFDCNSQDSGDVPLLALNNGSVASSGMSSADDGSHVNGVTRQKAPVRFVAVRASTCVVADALTKIVMALGGSAGELLGRFSASAILCEDRNWQLLHDG